MAVDLPLDRQHFPGTYKVESEASASDHAKIEECKPF